MDNQRVPILVYHHVYRDERMLGLEPSAGIIGETEFRRQMNHIAEQDWTVVSTDRVLDWLIDGTPLPERAVALHFDNGWADTRTVAFPILAGLGMQSICFVITDGVDAACRGESHIVRTSTEGITENPFMAWDQVRELRDGGWEIGAHTATHCRITDRYATDGEEGILCEICTSNEAFRRELGFAPAHFAYPSGSRNEQTDELLGQHYRSLRLWHCEDPIVWSFTDRNTSRLNIDCQNVDALTPFEDFKRIFTQALEV